MSYLFHEDKSKVNLSNELLQNIVLISNIIFPVGTIKITTTNVNPGNYLGGTWVAWGSGRVPVGINTSDSDFNTSEKTGGSKIGSYTPAGTVGSTTLTVNQIPSHAHGLNSHTHSVGAHSHGLNSHTHSVPAQQANVVVETGHEHFFNAYVDSGTDTGKWLMPRAIEAGSTAVRITDNKEQHTYGDTYFFYTGYASVQATTTGAATGSTANSSAFTSGAATGNTGNQGGNGGHNHGFTGTAADIGRLQPYITCYMWKRTA